MPELTDKQIERQDYVDNQIFQLLNDLNPLGKELKWDIEIIGDVREQIRVWLVDTLDITDEMKFYPYIGRDAISDILHVGGVKCAGS